MKFLYGTTAFLLFGCIGQVLDVGSDSPPVGRNNALPQGSMEGSYDPNTWPLVTPICDNPTFDATDANWPDVATCVAAATGTQSDIVGIWDGYSLDEYLSPSKKYRLTLRAASEGGPTCGTLKYGEGEPPPLSSDPAAWYPPLDSPYWGSALPATAETLGLLDGFVYSIVKGGQLDNQLIFSVSSYELYRGWCGLQNAYPSYWSMANGPFGAYYCSPGGGEEYGVSPLGGACTVRKGTTTVTFSAAQCTLCGVVGMSVGNCVCDSCHCTASMTSTDKVSLTFTGDTATGTIERTVEGRVHVNPASLRFTRVKPQ